MSDPGRTDDERQAELEARRARRQGQRESAARPRREVTPPPLRLGTSRPGAAPQATSPGSRRTGHRSAVHLSRIIALAVVVAIFWFVISLFQPFSSSTGTGHGRVVVIIRRGADRSAVAAQLARDGVISSAFFFKLRAGLDGTHVEAGRYVLAQGMTYGGVLHDLKAGPVAPPTTAVTIIPGKSRYQLNALLHAQGVAGSYLADTRHSATLNPVSYGAPASTPDLEGFLYPDTFDLDEPLSIPALVDAQLRDFKSQFAQLDLAYAHRHGLSDYDVVKIGSLEDAEAALPGDLAKVASVIYNRLAAGMDLGLDTTAAYAANNYGVNLTQAQLDSASRWNTLNHPGLPPTPIDSPDLAAMQAAAHPAHTDDLYFIVRVCGNGALNFTASYSQFLVWSRQYSTAVAQRGAQRAEFCTHHG